MAHKHSVYDTDPHFKIDASTRAIINQSETDQKIRLMQFDHNSERFTFELDRLVDGHDMSLCNRVEVHYLNIDAATKATNPDIYKVKDLGISPDSDDVVIFSWLISENATKYAGNLNYRIRFICTNEQSKVVYAWHTDIFKGVTVSDGIHNTEMVLEEYSDIIDQWDRKFQSLAEKYENMIVQEKGNSAAKVMSQKAVTSELAIFDKRITNLEASLSDDMFVTDATSAYEKAVPANVAPYAEINKIGGMTYKSKNLFNPADIQILVDGSNDGLTCTIDEDGVIHIKGTSTHDYWNVLIRLPFTLVGDYCIAGDGLGDHVCNVDGYGLDQYVIEGGEPFTSDGTSRLQMSFYNVGTFSVGTVLDMAVKIMINEGSTALPWEPYFEGLRHTPVTKLESHGSNLLDISKGLNECLVDNGDGTYTMYKNSSGRFSKKIPIYIPANTSAAISCKVLKYSNATFPYAQIQAIKSNGNGNSTFPFRDATGYMKSTDYDIVALTVYMDAGANVGDYVTFSEPTISIGTERTEYHPYSAEPIDTFEVPEAVQDREGYGVGISESEYNHILLDGDTVKEVKTCGVKVFSGNEKWSFEVVSTGNNFYTDEIFSNTVKTLVLSNHYSSTKDNASARDNIWISTTCRINVTADGYASLDEWIDQLKAWAAAGNPLTVIYPLVEPEITDITDLMPGDNFLEVQGNGKIIAVNENELAAPTTITYQKEG